MCVWLLLSGTSFALRQIYRCLNGDEDQNHAQATGYDHIFNEYVYHNSSSPSTTTRSISTVPNSYALPSSSSQTNPPPTSSYSSYSKDLPSSKPTLSPLLHTTTRSISTVPNSHALPYSPQTNPPTFSSSSYSMALPSSKPTLSPLLHNSTRNDQHTKQAQSYVCVASSPSYLKTLPSSKPTLSPLLQTNSTASNQHAKQAKSYVRVAADNKGGGGASLLIYMIPREIENLIKRDIVPDILKKPLSPSTYKDYFAALLYAEDFYIEKWSDYQLLDVKIKLHEASVYDKSSLKNKNLKKGAEKEDKSFAAFQIDSVPERRPFLLSRDFVYARPSGSEGNKFQGIVYRVVKSTEVLVEFGEEFYSQHHLTRKYDISFSFNRVCLKRAHQAISAASGPLFKSYIFPEGANTRNNTSSSDSAPHFGIDSNNSAVRRILSFKGTPPYLVEGPLCITGGSLSKTGLVVRDAVLQIYQRSSKPRILVCSTLNSTGDILMRSLKREIPESVMFRANAAFREVDEVPADIIPLCVYEGECFSFPSHEELKQFKVIFSTFVSSSRLVNQGIAAGHFSHIFLVDSSSATEPETMIPLSNYANEKTNVILTGAPTNRTGWVRSDIARKYGLRVSYFERLRATYVYNSSDPAFITQL
ncbi:hypothetical protein OROHE_015137 [Orobanche hederae]